MCIILMNGRKIVEGNALEPINLKIENGIITDIGEFPFEGRCIDLGGRLIMPGLVDVHVHLREPGFVEKETIETGSMAAARGGYTTICAMPNTDPVPDNPETFQDIDNMMKSKAKITVHPYASITKGLSSDECVDMEAIPAFAFTNDGKGIQSAQRMFEAMKRAAKIQKPIVAHTEDDSLVNGGVMHEGIRNVALNLPGINRVTESSQIARDIILAQEAGCHYHVCHVSCKESVDLIRYAKQQGIHVTAEVTPHHLLLNELDIESDDAMYKMNPPLRSQADRQALIEGLRDGTLDCIATDHAPHTCEEKAQGFRKAPFGITGSEIAFALLYTKCVETNIFTLEELCEWMAKKPANIFHLESGQLNIGDYADIAVFDLDASVTLKNEDFISKAKNTPFTNETLKGMCVLTIAKGDIVWNVI